MHGSFTSWCQTLILFLPCLILTAIGSSLLLCLLLIIMTFCYLSTSLFISFFISCSIFSFVIIVDNYYFHWFWLLLSRIPSPGTLKLTTDICIIAAVSTWFDRTLWCQSSILDTTMAIKLQLYLTEAMQMPPGERIWSHRESRNWLDFRSYEFLN